MLAVEAQTVIGLRLLMFGAGGAAAQAEAQRMIAEKANAFAEAAATLASGGSAHKVVAGYRKHVRANARRLRRHSSGLDSLLQSVRHTKGARPQ